MESNNRSLKVGAAAAIVIGLAAWAIAPDGCEDNKAKPVAASNSGPNEYPEPSAGVPPTEADPAMPQAPGEPLVPLTDDDPDLPAELQIFSKEVGRILFEMRGDIEKINRINDACTREDLESTLPAVKDELRGLIPCLELTTEFEQRVDGCASRFAEESEEPQDTRDLCRAIFLRADKELAADIDQCKRANPDAYHKQMTCEQAKAGDEYDMSPEGYDKMMEESVKELQEIQAKLMAEWGISFDDYSNASFSENDDRFLTELELFISTFEIAPKAWEDIESAANFIEGFSGQLRTRLEDVGNAENVDVDSYLSDFGRALAVLAD